MEGNDMLRVLTIGNSFSRNATRYLQEILAADGTREMLVGHADLGGCSLAKHWNLVKQCDQLPDVKPYLYRKTGCEPVPASLREILVDDAWAIVTLQQVSHYSWRPETYSPHIDNLYALVRELAPQARPVIHQTWAYREDATFFTEIDEPLNQKTMYEKLVKAYAECATRLHCPIIPCGAAFQAARERLGYTPDRDFDYAHPTPVELPDQSGSLIVGYHWRTGNTPSGNAELHMDYRHGNEAGCYLANAVWYARLTGGDIRTNAFMPPNVRPEDIPVLQEAAHAAAAAFGGSL